MKNWNDYRAEIDSADFSSDFSARTIRLLEAAQDGKEQKTMKTAKKSMRITLIAATLAVVLCISAAAVAVISASQARVRQELGVDPAHPISEYTVYAEDAAPAAENEVGGVKLLSTVCSGSRVDAFFLVKNAPAAAAEGKGNWEIGPINTQKNPATYIVSQLEYDADSSTALVELTMLCDAPENELTGINVALSHSTDEGITCYPEISVPITESRILTGEADVALPCGLVTRVNVAAGYVELQMSAAAVCTDDVDAIHTQTQAGRAAINEALADTSVQYADGSSVKVADMESVFASGWTLTNGDLDAMEKGSFAVQHICTKVLDTEQIVSVTVGGTVIPVA